MTKNVMRFSLISSWMLFFAACSSERSPEHSSQAAVRVRTVVAAIQPLSGRSTYSGTIEPIERVLLSTKISGWIDSILFEEGAEIAKGDILVKLRSQELDAKQAQAEAAIEEAEVHFKNARRNLQRIESLHNKNAATRKELDDMQAVFSTAVARRKTALEMKKEADELLRYTALSAPFNGVLSRKMLQQGDLANPGQPILLIENISKVKIVAKVPESEVLALESGMPVTIEVQASNWGTNGDLQTHTIDKIIPSADPGRQFDLHVVVDNPDGHLRSGMFARIATATTEEMTLLVPKKAVFRRGQLQGLFVVDSEKKARLRWIRTGAEQKGLIEVLTGLNSGEQVVVGGAPQLSDGQRVEVEQ